MRQQGAGRARRAPNQAQVTCRLDPGFRVDLHQNDLNLALASARALGLALPNTAAVQALFICGHVAKIERALALFMVVSWRIARLMRLGRTCADLPASLMFAPDEIKAAYVLTNKPSPSAPPSLNEVVRRVAMLGGFLARKGDGEPGVKTIWIGLQRVMDFAAGVRFMRDSGDGVSCV